MNKNHAVSELDRMYLSVLSLPVLSPPVPGVIAEGESLLFVTVGHTMTAGHAL